ncbi:MAG TPA: hypothetical protein VII09_05015 [Opitutaceae bacterium]
MKLRSRAFLAGLAALALGAAALRAQGGPPMLTDDPGTPGDGHWEFNLAWTEQQAPGSTLVGLPLLDANYGIGDRIQLNYQGSWNILRQSGSAQESGMSDSQVAVKWRFYDAGETGLQLSTFPRFIFLNPGSGSDRRGTADPHASFLLPLEVRRDFGVFSFNADFGHAFSGSRDDRGWIGGVCLGREIEKGWEVDAEVHVSASEHLGESEDILNVGTRYDLSKKATLLLAVGRDLHDSAGPQTSLLTFAGVQLRF